MVFLRRISVFLLFTPKIKDQTQVLNIPVKVPLVGGRYAELTGWNGSKRVDLKFWETDTIPTK
jgi:hypothetical protein